MLWTARFGPMLSPFKRFRFRLEHLALRGCQGLLPRLSHRALTRLALAGGWLGWHLDRRGHEAALDNLAVVFPQWTPKKRLLVARQSYQSMARTFLDLFWAAGRTREEVLALVELDPAVAELLPVWGKEGGIWLTPHYGNFEWLSACFAFRGAPCQIITQRFRNPALTGVFAELRRFGGHETIAQEGAALKLMRHLKRGGNVAFLPDLNIAPEGAAVPLRAFGRVMPVTPLHAMLAQRTGKPVLLWTFLPLAGGRYRMEHLGNFTVGAGEDLTAAVQRLWEVFERKIREHPQHYLWMYKHWRYQAGGGEEDYPAYANASRKFDRWLGVPGRGKGC